MTIWRESFPIFSICKKKRYWNVYNMYEKKKERKQNYYFTLEHLYYLINTLNFHMILCVCHLIQLLYFVKHIIFYYTGFGCDNHHHNNNAHNLYVLLLRYYWKWFGVHFRCFYYFLSCLTILYFVCSNVTWHIKSKYLKRGIEWMFCRFISIQHICIFDTTTNFWSERNKLIWHEHFNILSNFTNYMVIIIISIILDLVSWEYVVGCFCLM